MHILFVLFLNFTFLMWWLVCNLLHAAVLIFDECMPTLL